MAQEQSPYPLHVISRGRSSKSQYCAGDSSLLRLERIRSMIVRKPPFPAAIVVFLGCFLFAACAGFAQGSAQASSHARLTLSQVVELLTERNDERAAALAGYRSQRSYQIDYSGIPRNLHAEIVVELTYSAPSMEEFKVVSQSGSKFLIDRVLKRLLDLERESHEDRNRDGVQITGTNYNFTMLDWLDTGDGCPYVLGVEPKVPNKFLFRGRIWVDDKDFAVCRIEGEPVKNSSVWIKKAEIHHTYMKVGDFWLPAENTSTCHTRLEGRATVTIKYGKYEIQATHALKVHSSAP
jgi:hypothetical protein